MATAGVDAAAAAGRLRVLTGLTRLTGGGEGGDETGERKAIGSGDNGESGADFTSTAVMVGFDAASRGGGGDAVLAAAVGGGVADETLAGVGTVGAGLASFAGAAPGFGRGPGIDFGAAADSGLSVDRGRAETDAEAAGGRRDGPAGGALTRAFGIRLTGALAETDAGALTGRRWCCWCCCWIMSCWASHGDGRALSEPARFLKPLRSVFGGLYCD